MDAQASTGPQPRHGTHAAQGPVGASNTRYPHVATLGRQAGSEGLEAGQ